MPRYNDPPTAQEQDMMTRDLSPELRIADALERIADALEVFKIAHEQGELAVTTYDGDAAQQRTNRARESMDSRP